MNTNQGGSATAPISTQSQDHTLKGVCTCPEPRTFDSCTCGWSALIRQLLWIGYGQATQQAARGLQGLSEIALGEILEQRRQIYATLAANHRGTITEFLIAHQMSRALFYRLGLRIKKQ